MPIDGDTVFFYARLVAGAVILLLGLKFLYTRFIRETPIPPGLSLPPEPPGARLISGHSHIWALNVSNRPHETQLVKWACEYGEIYQIRLGSERWVVLSSPEAVRVGLK